MSKHRYIPFGYRMKNGVIIADPGETQAVAEIFKEYLNGRTLLQIAELMESRKIRYFCDSDKWNKHMVKRILENKKYLGTDTYPQIVTEDIFRKACALRSSKTAEVSEDLKEFKKIAYCSECGRKVYRKTNGSGREYWRCGNSYCFKYEYRLTDQMISGAVLTVLNSAIANPSLLESGGEVSVYSPAADIVRQQNEINRLMDTPDVEFETAKEEIFRLAELKYDCCTYSDKPRKTTQLQKILTNCEQQNTLDIGLFKSCVSKIWISRFCTIEVEFINGVRIKNTTERTDENEQNSKCDDHSCESADGGMP